MKDFSFYRDEIGEIGFVEEVSTAIAYVSGLPKATLFEYVIFETGELGQVFSLDKDQVEVLMLSKNPIRSGTQVARTNIKLEVPVGEELLGQMIDPLGNHVDGLKNKAKPKTYRPINSPAPGIGQRRRINRFLETGLALVDLMIPLGKGQRELSIGDRKTGKTLFLFKTIHNQINQGAICIYAAIGKKKIDIKKTEEIFIKSGMIEKSILVVSDAQDPPSLIYLTPYTAMTIAEYFRDQGIDVILVLDDLYTHAKFYRELSLIGKKFPGRDSYPGDIFYLHARLLERAGNFFCEKSPIKESSITCLPVVETTLGDLTGYIQTNVMSMTDGHLYFDHDLFIKGQRPAINPFLSVTRVGRQTQTHLMQEIGRTLITFLTRFEKMQGYVRFGAELSPDVKRMLDKGERIMLFFHQDIDDPIPINMQIAIFAMLWADFWENQPLEMVKEKIKKFYTDYKEKQDLKESVEKIIADSKSVLELASKIKGNLVNYG